MSGVRTPIVGSPNLSTHTGFLLAEDAALHTYLSGLTVPTKPGSSDVTEVGVWFRYPQSERALKYPFITIDMVNVSPAYDLWTSEYVQNPNTYRPSVAPALPEPEPDMQYAVRPFLPFRIMYQITVYCRSSLHDRYLNSLFFTDIIPPRPFWIGVDADNTWRRCELIDFAQNDITETSESGDKRVFRKMYTITVHAEVPQDVPYQVYKVLRTFVAVVERDRVDDYFNNILRPDGVDELTPNETFTVAEREAEGELFNYANVPPSS